MALTASPVNESGVTMTVSGNKIVMKGNVDSAQPGKFMQPFFAEVHENILKNGIKSIEVDIKELNFLNSSGIKELVAWIMKLESVPAAEQYKIKFLCNKDLLWQESSISTILFLNPDMISQEY